MKGIGIIPARAGSKRLKNKNLLTINGVSLTMIAYDILCMAGLDRVIVATDIDKIYGKLNEESRLWRPYELNNDQIPVQEVIKWAYMEIDEYYKYDYIVVLLPNCPGITSMDIQEAIDMMFEHSLNLVRSYDTNGVENGLLVARRDYYMAHWVDTYVGGIVTKAMEIHTEDDYKIVKGVLEKHIKDL